MSGEELVSVHAQDGRLCGSGILVNSTLVLTCAHVVNVALDRPQAAQERPPADRPICIRFNRAPGVTENAFLADDADAWSPLDPKYETERADVCLLRLKNAAPARTRPAPISVRPEIPDCAKVRAGGYPLDWAIDGPSVDYADGVVIGWDRHLWMLGGDAARAALTAAINRPAQGLARTGYSGGPVTLDGTVIAMLVAVQAPDVQSGLVSRFVGGRSAPRDGTAYLLPAAQFPAAVREPPPTWRDHLRAQAELWSSVEQASPGLIARLAAIADRAEQLVRSAPADPESAVWVDGDRVLRRTLSVVSLLARKPGDPPSRSWLTPAEAACALAVPCVYEAILAAFRAMLATDQRFSRAIEAQLDEDGLRSRWEVRLVQEGQGTLAAQLQALRRLRIAHRQAELWSYVDDRAASGAALSAVFAPTDCGPSDKDSQRILSGWRLVALARQLIATSEELKSGDRSEDAAFKTEVNLLPEALGGLDGPDLAHLLAMAGRMALDPRRMPAVAVDHLGVDPALDVDLLLAQLDPTDGARWGRKGDTARVSLDCRAAAIAVAIADTVAELQDLNRAQRPERARENLPTAVSDDGVKPAVEGTTAKYTHPHRFTQDAGRLLDLLSSVELYGDSAVALRELFQNALDACRYRTARLEHHRRSGRPDFLPRWQPHIRFEAGHDADGRCYLACEDSGIGMADAHLNELFTCAGARFVEYREFQLEQAAWLKAGIPFHANSRFGLGVLSVFMLADEVLVQSRRVDKAGQPGKGVRTTLRGPRSLFWVEADEAACIEGGTRVTLWLRDGLRLEPLDQLVKRWLWIPEVEVKIVDEIEGSPVILPAGRPTPEAENRLGPLIPIPDPDDTLGQPRVFWCEKVLDNRSDPNRSGNALPEDTGALLLDGVLVRDQSSSLGFELAGLVVNVTRGPSLVVSLGRNQVHETDGVPAWLEAHLLKFGASKLQSIPGMDGERLGRLFNLHPNVVIAIDRDYLQNGPHLCEGDMQRSALGDSRYYVNVNRFQSRLLAGRASDWKMESGELDVFRAFGRHLKAGRPMLGAFSLAEKVDKQGLLSPVDAVIAAHNWRQPLRYIRTCIESGSATGISCDPALKGDLDPKLTASSFDLLTSAADLRCLDRPALARYALSRRKTLRQVYEDAKLLAEYGLLEPHAALPVDDIAFREIDRKLFGNNWGGATRVSLGSVFAARHAGIDLPVLKASLERLGAVGLLSFQDPEAALLNSFPPSVLTLLQRDPGRKPRPGAIEWRERVDLRQWAHLHNTDRAWLESVEQDSNVAALLRHQGILDCELVVRSSLLEAELQGKLGLTLRWPLSLPDALELLSWPSTRAALLPRLDDLARDGLLAFVPALIPDLLPSEPFDNERLFAGTWEWHTREVTPWKVTVAAARRQQPLASLHGKIKLLAAGGVPAEDALDFLEFARQSSA